MPSLFILAYSAWLDIAQENWYGACFTRPDKTALLWPAWAAQVRDARWRSDVERRSAAVLAEVLLVKISTV
jgi:hypothetical protein